MSHVENISYYASVVRDTDRLPPGSLTPPTMGLFGEVGSLLAIPKKKSREADVYSPSIPAAISEELGDTAWYLACMSGRLGLDLRCLVRHSSPLTTWKELQHVVHRLDDDSVRLLLELGSRAGRLVQLAIDEAQGPEALTVELGEILSLLARVASAYGLQLDHIIAENLRKITSRYPQEFVYPALADGHLESHEQLPRRFEMHIEEISAGGRVYVIQRCNGIVIGDRLTDAKAEADDYRFHDVFHIAYAVHLGWSPVLRALFRVKRKGDPKTDEAQDGARAILVEEGVSSLVFGRALDRNLLSGHSHLGYDLLKLVSEFVQGFEVESCALWQWERAILDGFEMFRALKKSRCGVIHADLEKHTLEFKVA